MCITLYDPGVVKKAARALTASVTDPQLASAQSATASDVLEQRAADILWRAAAQHVLVGPPRIAMLNPDLAAGYRVQALNAARAMSGGRVPAGYKVAMTSAAVQAQFGIEHPTSGVIFRDTIMKSGAKIEAPLQGRVEGEIAFEMAHDLEVPDPTLAQVIACVARALPAIEVVDCRIRDWDLTSFDFVADNAAAAKVVLGTDEIAVSIDELATIAMRIRINGKVRATGGGADCTAGPLQALHWLAVHLIQNGNRLKAGDIIMSGSLGPAAAISADDTVDVRVGDTCPVRVQFY